MPSESESWRIPPNLPVPFLSNPGDGWGDQTVVQGPFNAASLVESLATYSSPIPHFITFCAEMGAHNMKSPWTKAVGGYSRLDSAGGKVHCTRSVPAFSHSPSRPAGRVVCIYFSLNEQSKQTAIQQVKPTPDGIAV